MDAIFHRIAGGEQQHGNCDSIAAQLRQDLAAVAAGQHDVQKQEVELPGVEQVEALFAGSGYRNLIALRLEPFLQGVRQLRFVFHDKDIHPLFHIPRFNIWPQLKSP